MEGLNFLNFLKKYKISEEDFATTSLQWDKLMEIYDDFKSRAQELELAADLISSSLKKVNKVHSVRQRIKDPEHLIEKIIRKRLENQDRHITLENYTEEITDLIGIRAIHLFKEDWESIHDYISKTWDLAENPKANIRKGDSGDLIDNFKKKDLDIKEHKYGYRSIHYLIEVKPYKIKYITEIQVRTIFEEGWSEIDHEIRYPYYIDNPILANYLVIFNRLAGSADEMGSFVKFLCGQLNNIEDCHTKELEEKNKMIDELKDTINQLQINETEKEDLQKKINSIKKEIIKSSLYGTRYSVSDILNLQPNIKKINIAPSFITKEITKLSLNDTRYSASDILNIKPNIKKIDIAPSFITKRTDITSTSKTIADAIAKPKK